MAHVLKRRGRRRSVLGLLPLAVLALLAACSVHPQPIAIDARRSTTDQSPTPEPSQPAAVPDTTALGSVSPSTPVESVPVTEQADMEQADMEQADIRPASTSAGDDRYPYLGSDDLDVDHYDVAIRYDEQQQRFTGSVVVTGALSDELNGAIDQLALDARGPEIDAVFVDGRPGQFVLVDGELLIGLGAPHAAGDSFDVAIDFQSSVAAGGAFFDTAGVFPGITRPGVWAVNEPDGASTWLPVNDHPTDKATWTFRLTAGSDLTAVANGRLAATSEDGDVTTWVWEQDEPMASYLITLLIGDYRIVPGGTSTTGVELQHVALAGSESGLDDYGEITDQQLAFFERWFGPYPFDRYGIAIADSINGLAMETQGLSLFSAGDLDGERGFLQHLLLAHELAHQWFGDAVSPAEWDDIWLNEGWATYCQWMWLEQAGFQDLETAAAQALASRVPDDGPVGSPDELFGDASYNGGAVALHALRRLVGDDAFFEGARRWVADHLDSAATTADFRRVMEQTSGLDLSAWESEWLQSEQQPRQFPEAAQRN